MRIGNALDLSELGATPATPGTGVERLYAKSGGLYYKNSAGTEVGPLGTGGSGGSSVATVQKSVSGNGGSPYAITTTPGIPSGCSWTVTTSGTYSVTFFCDFIWGTGDGALVGEMYLAGAVLSERRQALMVGTTAGQRGTYGNTCLVAATAGQVLSLQLSKSSGTGASTGGAQHTGFVATLPGSGAVTATGTPITVAVATTDYSATNNQVVLANAASGPILVSLPTATLGAQVTVKKTDASTNVVNVYPSLVNIDGLSGPFTLTNQYSSVTLVGDGTNWFII